MCGMYQHVETSWPLGVDYAQQPSYQPVVDCTYWYMLGYFYKQNIIQFTNETTSSEDFDEVNTFVLDEISDNM